MRQQKQHRSKIAGVKKGDQVVTAGGIVGKVIKVDDNYADVEIAQGVKVKAVKSTHRRHHPARRHAGQRLTGATSDARFSPSGSRSGSGR